MRASSAKMLAGLRALIGVDELVLLVALTLIVIALWPIVGCRALLAPGVVLLWIALPARAPFLVRPPEKPPRRT